MNDLPPGWARVVVDDVTSEVRSGFASGKHNATGEGIAHLRPMNVSRLGEIDLSEVKYVDPAVDDRRLQPGDILFNNTNSPALVGKTALVRQVSGEHAFSNHMTRLRVVPGVVPAFLASQLHFLWMTGRLSNLITNHVNQASISAKVLSGQVEVALPPTAEQERIVAAIEENLSSLDDAAAALHSALRRLSMLRWGPAEEVWRRATSFEPLGSLGRIVTGSTPESKDRDLWGNDFPFATPGDLEAGGTLRATQRGLSHAGVDVARWLPKDSVLVTCIGATLGKAAISEVDTSFNQQINGIETTGVSPRYLLAVLSCPAGQRVLWGASSSTTMPILNKGRFAKVEVPVVPAEEQARVEAERDALDVASSRVRMEIDSSLARADSLRHSVLAAAFSGQLVPQVPSDEPAWLLLDRIRAERIAAIPAKRTRKAKAS